MAATAIGLVVAIGVGSLLPGGGSDPVVQVAVAITLCAMIARRWPLLRVCMWTSAIVLMTTQPGHGIASTGLERGSEVLLGATVAVLLHVAIDAVLVLMMRRFNLMGAGTAMVPPDQSGRHVDVKTDRRSDTSTNNSCR